MEELKPCPFCGENSRAAENYEKQWGVHCLLCHAVVWGSTKEEAIKKWNRRAAE